MDKIQNWQELINKPVFSSDETEIGIISDVQPIHVIVSSGSITPNKYNIAKKSVNKFENGVVSLNVDQKYVENILFFINLTQYIKILTCHIIGKLRKSLYIRIHSYEIANELL